MRINPVFIFNTQIKKPSPFDFGKNPFLTCPIKTDSFEKTTAQNTPSFEGFKCETGDFRPRNLYNMPCASCGQKCLTNMQANIAANNLINKTGEDLIAALLKKNDYYRPAESIIVGSLIANAEKYPDKNMEELIKYSAAEHKENLEKTQEKILENIKNKATALEANNAATLCNFIDKSILEIRNSNETCYFKRKSFLNNLKGIGKNFKNQEAFSEILQTAEKLPTSKDSISAFYVKYSRRSNQEIAYRLFVPARATTEHIVPASEGGPNNTKNYMVMCGNCNSQRSTMPYSKWMETNPDMPINFKKYIDEVILRLEFGELSDIYANYPSEVCKTVEKATLGVIKVEGVAGNIKQKKERIAKEPPSVKQRAQDALKILKRRKQELYNLKKTKEELRQDSEYLAIVQYFAIEEQINSLKTEKNKASKEINALRVKLKAKASKEKKLNELQETNTTKELMSQKAEKNKSDIQSLQSKVKKAEDIEEKMETAKRNYALISEKISSLIEAKNTQFQAFRLPEDIKQEQKQLQEMLNIRVNCREAIREKQVQNAESQKALLKADKLKNQLQTLIDKNRAMKINTNLECSENKKHTGPYLELKKKAEILNDISDESLKPIVKSKFGINPNFIKEEALSSVNKKLEELMQYDIVQYMENIEQIEKLQKEIDAIHEDVKAKAKNGKSLEVLLKELETLEQEANSGNIRAKITLLENSYQSTKDKIDNLDIDNKIRISKRGVTAAVENYRKLSNLSSKSNVVNNT